MKICSFLASFVVTLFVTTIAAAQAETQPTDSNVETSLPQSDKASLRKLLDDPAAVTTALAKALGKQGEGWQLLKGLQVTPVAIDSESSGSVIGLKYELKQSVANTDLSPQNDKSVTRGLSYVIDATGTLVADETKNPEDFLLNEFSVHFFNSHGGVSERIGGETFNKISAALADIEDEKELDAEWRKVQEELQGALSTQFVVDFAAHAAVEAEQSTQSRQTAYGAQFALDIKPWNPKSSLARLNMFDHPFALLRLLSGYDDTFAPRGSAFPTVLVAVDRVNPSGETPRSKAGDTSNFSRLRFEASLRSPIAAAGETAYFIDLNYRWYQELSPSDVVQQAHLQTNRYFTAAITTSTGVFASYSRGSLPFGVTNESNYQLGFHFNFD